MRKIVDLVRNKAPVILRADATVQQACAQMRDQAVGAVVVANDDDHMVGIFTGRDAVARVVAAGRDPVRTRLWDVMTPAPKSLSPDKTAMEALRLMEDCAIRHLPVTQDGKVVSVISRADFRGQELARLDEESGLWERI